MANLNQIKDYCSSKVNQSNTNTILKLLPFWQENTRMNSALLYSDLSELNGAEQGGTVVIVAAGPSFKKNIPWLQKCPFPILVIDCMYRKLKKNGITPKYVVAIDPIREPIGAGKEILIYDVKCNYKIASEWEGERYVHLGQFPQSPYDYFADIFKRTPKMKSVIPSAGNVTSRSLVIARENLRAKRIVLVAHDYCDYNDLQMRKWGVMYRFHTFENTGDGKLNHWTTKSLAENTAPIRWTGNGNGLPKRWTKDDYLRYAQWTRDYIDKTRGHTDYVVTEEGSLINTAAPDPQYEIITLRNFIKREMKNGNV